MLFFEKTIKIAHKYFPAHIGTTEGVKEIGAPLTLGPKMVQCFRSTLHGQGIFLSPLPLVPHPTLLRHHSTAPLN